MPSANITDKFSLYLHRLVIWLETEAQNQLQDSLGISFSEFMVMYMIANMKATSQSQVADYTNHTEAAISRQIKKLIHLELVNKSKHPTSKRESVLELTPKGMEIFEKAQEKLFILYGSVFDSLGNQEQVGFNKSLLKMSDFAIQNFSFLKNCHTPNPSNN